MVDGFPGFPDDINENLEQNNEICDEISMQWARIEDLEQLLIIQGDLGNITKRKLDNIKKHLTDETKKIIEKPLAIHKHPTLQTNEIDEIYAENMWRAVPGQAFGQTSVGSYQHIWGTTPDGRIWQRKSAENEWWESDPKARGIYVSVGSDGTAWVVNIKNQIYRWDINKWTGIPGGLKQISVGSKDHVWGINAKGDVYEWANNGWKLHSNAETGTFTLLSTGSDGTVVLLKSNHQVYKWNKDKELFEQIDGELSYISVGKASEIWGIDTKSQVVKWNEDTWEPLPGTRKLTSISAGDDGTVWGVDGQGNVFTLNREPF